MRSRLFADISSSGNSHFDAKAYRKAGHVVIGNKATEGKTFTSSTWAMWTRQAHAAGISVIHYHFARPDDGNSPEQEAAHFVATIRPLLQHGDWVALDYERFTGRGSSADAEWCNAFWQYVHKAIGYRCWLYASRSVLQVLVESGKLRIKRFWDADWGDSADFKAPPFWTIARQRSNGVSGPEPHSITGVGRCDVDKLSLRVFLKIGRH
jgi:lysozyme